MDSSVPSIKKKDKNHVVFEIYVYQMGGLLIDFNQVVYWFLKNKRMECTNLVDPHQLLYSWFTVVFVLFCIYTPDNHFPRPIVKQGRGLFWILSDSNVSFDGQSSFSRGLSNMIPLWQRIDICSPVVFIPTMWLEKTFHSVFSFFF
jgi:hypothetical protein